MIANGRLTIAAQPIPIIAISAYSGRAECANRYTPANPAAMTARQAECTFTTSYFFASGSSTSAGKAAATAFSIRKLIDIMRPVASSPSSGNRCWTKAIMYTNIVCTPIQLNELAARTLRKSVRS